MDTHKNFSYSNLHLAFPAWRIYFKLSFDFGNFTCQCISVPTKIKLSIKFVLGIWVLMTIVVTNGYSGVLASLMSKTIIPPFPESLEELTNSSLPLLSFSGTPLVNESSGFAYLKPPDYSYATCGHCLKIIIRFLILFDPVNLFSRLLKFAAALSGNNDIETSSGRTPQYPR